MLALRNNNKLTGNNGKPLVNAEITSLQVVNTNGFQISIITTGPIRVYWGDGTYTDVPTKTTLYTVGKTYTTTSNYNIVITNQGNITKMAFISGFVGKINTSVAWFSQFYNLNYIQLTNASFIGDLAPVIEKMYSMTKLDLYYGASSPCYINVSNCKTFWNRCDYVSVQNYGSLVQGSYSDINLSLNCTYIRFFYTSISGNLSGIIKNGYTSLTSIALYASSGTVSQGDIINIDDWIIPDTLLTISSLRGFSNNSTGSAHGNLVNFNFKNLTIFNTEGSYSNIDLRNNNSFKNAIGNTIDSFGVWALTNVPVRINLADFTKTSYATIQISTSKNYNFSVGDIATLSNKVYGTLFMSGGLLDNAISGILSNNIKSTFTYFDNIDCNINADVFKYLLARQNYAAFSALPNATGDISNAYFSQHAAWNITISNMSNLYADITTFTYNPSYINEYGSLQFNNNPHFTGNLGNLSILPNKQGWILQNCAYTNIPGLINNLFTQRNTCLKASGGVTTINVAGNVDNASLTGTYQRGSLGTFTGNQNDLTEAQIDNLAAGLDYTGSGSSTAWSHKEKIWWLVNCKNSSTDSSSRYRVNITY